MSENAGSELSPAIGLAVDIVAAYVSNNSVPVSELPGLIGGIHAALNSLTTQGRAANLERREAQSVADPQISHE